VDVDVGEQRGGGGLMTGRELSRLALVWGVSAFFSPSSLDRPTDRPRNS
jgi:hypothetical protein